MKPNASKPKRGAGKSRDTGAALHPGVLLAEVLDDTPATVAAKWFGMRPDDFEKLLAGRIPMTTEVATIAGSVFGTGAAPWLDTAKRWEEAQHPQPSEKED